MQSISELLEAVGGVWEVVRVLAIGIVLFVIGRRLVVRVLDRGEKYERDEDGNRWRITH